jgi:predicted alpha/beta hydrolase family esterase
MLEQKMNCIIIHGCPSNIEKAMDEKTRTYDKHWIPWTKNELSSKGIRTETPLMPEPWYPDYNKFKKEFEKYRDKVTEDTILIGHSCGCTFLVRWLGETKQKINKLILVAPWKIPDKNDAHRKAFYTYSIDESIKNRVDNIIIFTADDEANDGKEGLKLYHNSLGGKIIELKGHGHYTMGDMGTTEFPELIKEVVE